VQLEVGNTATAFALTSSAWTPGGYTSPAIILERSNDGGATFVLVRRTSVDTVLNGGVTVPVSTKRYTATDYEAARPGTVLYRAQAVDINAASGNVISSGYTTNLSLTTTSDGRYWLKAVTNPALNTGAVKVKAGPTFSMVEDTAIMRPFGRREAVVVAGDMHGQDGPLTLYAFTTAEWEALSALVTYQGTLLYQEPFLDSAGRGLQKWIRLVDDRQGERLSAGTDRSWSGRYVEVDKGY
jgi:hypothetical protein